MTLGLLSGSVVKNLPVMQETWILSLGREDPLEEEAATHPNISAWRIPRKEEPGKLQFMGLKRLGCNLASNQQEMTP